MKQQRTPLVLALLVLAALIAVALAFFALQRPVERKTETPRTTTTLPPPDAIALVSAAEKTIAIRNAGTAAFRTAEVVVYLDNIIVPCLWDVAVVNPQQSATCTLQGPTCLDKGLRVVGPSNEESTRC